MQRSCGMLFQAFSTLCRTLFLHTFVWCHLLIACYIPIKLTFCRSSLSLSSYKSTVVVVVAALPASSRRRHHFVWRRFLMGQQHCSTWILFEFQLGKPAPLSLNAMYCRSVGPHTHGARDPSPTVGDQNRARFPQLRDELCTANNA